MEINGRDISIFDSHFVYVSLNEVITVVEKMPFTSMNHYGSSVYSTTSGLLTLCALQRKGLWTAGNKYTWNKTVINKESDNICDLPIVNMITVITENFT